MTRFILISVLVFAFALTHPISAQAEDPEAAFDEATTAMELEETTPIAGEGEEEPDFVDAERFRNIEPALGDENSTYEQEAEIKLRTNVESTTVNRGDGDVSTHDSLGDGQVGVFYDYNNSGRIMDDDEAIGIEFRVLEFE